MHFEYTMDAMSVDHDGVCASAEEVTVRTETARRMDLNVMLDLQKRNGCHPKMAPEMFPKQKGLTFFAES